MTEQEKNQETPIIKTGVVKPNNYLVGSILATLFCCLPLGIVSIVYAAQVDSKYNAGDQEGALEASKKAKQFMIYTIIAGVVFLVGYFAIVGTAILGVAAQQ